jgi:hypothetical protein
MLCRGFLDNSVEKSIPIVGTSGDKFVEFPDFCFGRLSPEVEAELEILTLVSFEF